MPLLQSTPRQGRTSLRFVFVGSLAFTAMCGLSRSQNGTFSVKDDIAMVRFSDPSAETQASPDNEANVSPDRKHVAIVTTKGLLESDQIQSTISVFEIESVRAFLDHPSQPLPMPRIIARIATVPHFEQIVPYAPVIKDVRWSQDGQHLYFRGEARNGAWQLYQANADGRPVRNMTSPSYNVDRFDISNNTVVYTASVYGDETNPRGRIINRDALDVTGHPLIDILFPGQMPTYVPEKFSLYVLRLDKHDGKSIRVPDYSVSEISFLLHFLPFQLSPDGHQLVTTTPVARIPASWKGYDPPLRFEDRRLDPDDPSLTDPDNVLRPRQYSLVDLSSGKITPLIDAPNAQNLGYYSTKNRAAWSADTSRVLLTNVFLPLRKGDEDISIRQKGPCAVATVDLPSFAFRCLFFEADGPSPSVGNVDDVSFAGSRDEVEVFVKHGSADSTAMEYRFQNGVWTLDERKPATDTQRSSGTMPLGSTEGSGGIRVFIKQGLNEPPTLWAVDTRTGSEHQIWNPNPQLLHLQMGEASVYQWKDRAGRDWTAGLIKPVGYIQGKRYPLVIQMYEFDEKRFLTDGTDPTAFAARELASAGFVVLQIRKKKVDLSDEDAQIHLEAYRSAIEHLSDAGLIDPNKVGVVGFSWTCWYVVNALVKSPRLFAAATIAEGFDNSYMQYMLFGPGSPNPREQMNQLRGGSPFGPGLQQWVRDAPGFHLDRVQTPLRIEAMKPATILNEWEIYAGLNMQHKPVDMIYFPSGTHIHQRPLERLESQQGDIDWMRFWLQEYEDPAPEKRAQYAGWEKLKLNVKVSSGAAETP
jgi:dipeptidyl aminopeptidase/acylaminoacyl peptidase